ncbi:MAG TPA: lamin tail domain-containing protein, partial [Promineifilum sp.]|nr:lamin tail domain-containing protein [Promineifilum sp.]
MNHLRTARRSTSWWVRPILLTLILFAAIVTSVSPHFNRPVAALSPDIVISQVYGGGGAAVGSTYTNDFVELFNRGATAVDVTGWSIQYASAAGTGLFGATTVVITPLSGTLQPGQYLLVEGAVSTATPTGVPLPTPDVTDTSPINLSGSSGKVALVTDSTPLGCNGGSTPCDAGMLARIQDLVGYGATATTPPNFFEGTVPAPEPAPSASNGVQRKDGGCTETDDNGADFLEAIPAPRNMASTFNPCYPDTSIDSNPTDPSNSANASFTFSSADAGSMFECQLDGGGWATCTSPQNYAGLADSSHTFEVKATNMRGNTDPTPASWTWLIDTMPP